MKTNETDVKYRKLNDFIRGEMKRKGVTQEVVANWLNLPRPCISYRLNGKIEWTAREIISVFELLGVENGWDC